MGASLLALAKLLISLWSTIYGAYLNQYSKTTVIRKERDKQISKADITKKGSSFRQLIHPLQKNNSG